MATDAQEPNELDKLLADVQRTIRENEKFLLSLKKESVDSDEADSEEESESDGTACAEDYEEL